MHGRNSIPQSGPARLRDDAIRRHRDGDLTSARELYYQALLYYPDDPDIWTNLGAIFRATRQYLAAVKAQEKAVEFSPANMSVLNNLANAYEDAGFHDKAIALRRQFVEADPRSAEKLAVLVRSLRNGRYLKEAEDVVRQGLASGVECPELLLEHSFNNLLSGNYAEGFKFYLSRRLAGLVPGPGTRITRWSGQDPRGKTFLVVAEQGFGDTICFSRFLPYLKERGAIVHLLVPSPLFRVLEDLDGVDKVIAEAKAGRGYDFWTSPMDIPVDYFHFRNTIPPPPRLCLPQASRERANALVAAHQDTLKVGCNWRGSEGYSRNEVRSTTHRSFFELSKLDGVQLFSLYKGPAIEDYYADGTAAVMLDTASSDSDLADCAAVLERMDLVITVDTVTAHIAGALGKEVWNLLHWEPFWLYGQSGSSTPWYSSMKLYRQDKPFDWDSVFSKVASDLASRLATVGERVDE